MAVKSRMQPPAIGFVHPQTFYILQNRTQIPVLHIVKLRLGKGGNYRKDITESKAEISYLETGKWNFQDDLLRDTITPDMFSSSEEVFLVLILLEATTGLVSCFFMLLCLSVKEFRSKNMKSYCRILIFLNMSNICYTSSLGINYAVSLVRPDLFSKTFVAFTISYTTLYSITSSLWLSAILCVFYFMKIMPSQPGLLATLKRRIDAIVWWMIIMAEVVALGGSLLIMLISIPPRNQGNSSVISSEMVEGTNGQSATFMSIVLSLNSLPILIIMMATIGSTLFLRLYNYQIQKKLSISGNTRVRDYRGSIHTMIGLLVLYTLLLLFAILLTLNVFLYLSLGYFICAMFLFSFTTLLSALLIYGNPKLKEAAKQIFTL
ncbi:taste receptor type 2 member 40-like [Anomaloglossus baeobatrachus]|uniref:taste receptor type 2 member 40-like n=1 Tax=Anomaloglossus baeobatrachus TaxID=238106 RepID=UPI003F508EC4